MSRIKLLLVTCLFIVCSNVMAQNSLWFVVMTKCTFKQSYKKSAYWPSSWISEKLGEGQYVTDVTYGAGVWGVIVGKGQSYYAQRIKRNETFPSDWVSERWDDDYTLDHVAYGNGEWVVVMHKGSKLKSESWATRREWDDMREFIKSKWDEDKDITSIEYGNGVWCTVLAKNTGFKTQSYKWSETYPGDWIKKKFDDDYNITDVAYGEGQWVVVMSKLESSKYESCATRRDFPSTYIKEKWDNDQRVTSLQYNYQIDNTEKYEDVYEKGLTAYRSKDYTLAIYYFGKALDLRPNDVEALNMRGWTKYLDGQCNGALIDANRAINNSGRKHYILHTRGAAYLCLGRCSEAIADFTSAINQSASATYYADRGQAKACLGRYNDAIADYNIALGKSPDNADEIRGWKQEAESKLRIVKKPTITWDYPYHQTTVTTQGNMTLQACINSESSITGIDVSVNGSSFKARGLTIEGNCTDNVNQTINLRPGRNVVKITARTAYGSATSEERIVQYKVASTTSYHALLIGVQDYDDYSIEDLDNPVSELTSLKSVLTSNYTFNQSDVTLLANPSKRDIINELIKLQDELNERDHLLVFYSGHGNLVNNVGYWLPKDARKSDRSTWLSNSEVIDYMKGMKSKHTLVVSDACFSGSIITAKYRNLQEFACEQMEKLPSRRAMTSGALAIVSDESVFMKYLIQNLRNNTSQCISAEELYSKIKPAVIYNSPNQQVPQFGVLPYAGDEGGNFIFKRK